MPDCTPVQGGNDRILQRALRCVEPVMPSLNESSEDPADVAFDRDGRLIMDRFCRLDHMHYDGVAEDTPGTRAVAQSHGSFSIVPAQDLDSAYELDNDGEPMDIDTDREAPGASVGEDPEGQMAPAVNVVTLGTPVLGGDEMSVDRSSNSGSDDEEYDPGSDDGEEASPAVNAVVLGAPIPYSDQMSVDFDSNSEKPGSGSDDEAPDVYDDEAPDVYDDGDEEPDDYDGNEEPEDYEPDVYDDAEGASGVAGNSEASFTPGYGDEVPKIDGGDSEEFDVAGVDVEVIYITGNENETPNIYDGVDFEEPTALIFYEETIAPPVGAGEPMFVDSSEAPSVSDDIVAGLYV